MKQLLFKILNAAFITGTFLHYMLNEKYPLIVIQALTYQVRVDEMKQKIAYNLWLSPRVFFFCLCTLSLSSWNVLFRHLNVGINVIIQSMMISIYFVFRTDHVSPSHRVPRGHPHLSPVLGSRHSGWLQGPGHLQEPLLPQPEHRVLPPLHAGDWQAGVAVQQGHPPLQIRDRLRVNAMDSTKFRWLSIYFLRSYSCTIVTF